jgi:hypothetical protein
VLAVGLLLRTLATADLARVQALVANAGAWVAVGLVPYVFVVAFDVAGWRVLLGELARPPLATLVRIRMRCDAFGATLPGGPLIAESVAPMWLRPSMPVDTGVAAVAGRKCFVGFAEGVYMLASCAVGFSHARAPGLPWLVLGLSLGMMAMFGATALALASGSIAARVHRALAALPVPALRSWLAARSGGFTTTDERLGALFRSSPRRLLTAGVLFVLCWSVESVETWILLRLLGVELSFLTVFSFEASVSLLRSIGCFAPGALGVQDLGYVAALGAVGVPEAVTVGAAFVVLKRAKELFWSLAGWATLLSPAGRTEPAVAVTRPEPALAALDGAT